MVIPLWLMLLCSVVMGVGTSVGGEKIIKSVGMDMVRLEKYQGFSADLSAALKNDTKARFLIITENRGAIPNMPYDAMVELPAYIGKNGPEVIARDNIPLFQQGLMMQQLNSEKLLVEGCVEGSYEKVLQAFTLNKTVPSMNVAKAILDDMIEANKGYWPELH